jgi:exonuclease III
LCVQETRWKVKGKWLESDKAKCKFFGTGSSTEGFSGVGVLVAEMWCDDIIEVKRPSERVIVVRVPIGKRVLNVISVYAPQVGRMRIEKEEFLHLSRGVISGIDDRKGMILCGDLNCHAGTNADGFEDVHGGNGFGLRNVEGEMVLQLAHALDLIVANT